MAKSIMLVTNLHRDDVTQAAQEVRKEAKRLGVTILEKETPEIPDVVLALGGDGTFLASAEYARKWEVPLLGINFGRMGFLTDMHEASWAEVMEMLARDQFRVDKRMTLDAKVVEANGTIYTGWALNEIAILHKDTAHPADVVFAVDGQSVSTYATDGILIATPTGSTAYSFSAGGPVVWPNVEAIVMTPLAAHGLFTRPLVVDPSSELAVGILPENQSASAVVFDGSRKKLAPPGSQVVVRKSNRPIRIAKLDCIPFSTRLVTKFALPATGWRQMPGGVANKTLGCQSKQRK